MSKMTGMRKLKWSVIFRFKALCQKIEIIFRPQKVCPLKSWRNIRIYFHFLTGKTNYMPSGIPILGFAFQGWWWIYFNCRAGTGELNRIVISFELLIFWRSWEHLDGTQQSPSFRWKWVIMVRLLKMTCLLGYDQRDWPRWKWRN